MYKPRLNGYKDNLREECAMHSLILHALLLHAALRIRRIERTLITFLIGLTDPQICQSHWKLSIVRVCVYVCLFVCAWLIRCLPQRHTHGVYVIREQEKERVWEGRRRGTPRRDADANVLAARIIQQKYSAFHWSSTHIKQSSTRKYPSKTCKKMQKQ